MARRGKFNTSNDVFLDMYRNPFKYVDRAQLYDLIEKTKKDIQSVCGDKQIMLATSGGKDSICVSELFKDADVDAVRVHARYGMTPTGVKPECDYEVDAGFDWADLSVDTQYLFAKDRKTKSKMWSRGHQRALLTEAKKYDMLVMGRRTEENTVRDKLYRHKGKDVLQYFPIKDWSQEDIFGYLYLKGIELPDYYLLPDGFILSGQYSILAQMQNWEQVADYDLIQLERASKYFEEAREIYENRKD